MGLPSACLRIVRPTVPYCPGGSTLVCVSRLFLFQQAFAWATKLSMPMPLWVALVEQWQCFASCGPVQPHWYALGGGYCTGYCLLTAV